MATRCEASLPVGRQALLRFSPRSSRGAGPAVPRGSEATFTGLPAH